jgi:opacity protein-like surface antigen
METLKKSIIAVVLTIGTLTIAQAQETTRKGWDGTVKGGKTEAQSHEIKRKGWDGTIKGKQTQGATFGEKLTTETTIKTESEVYQSKRGYDYYKSQSDTDTESVRLTNNKHPELMKQESSEISKTIQEENQDKIKLPTTTKKEYVGHVTLLK